MPIIIDEVVISINVENRGVSASNGSAQSSHGTSRELAKQQIIEECVEQVMEILRQQKEP
jgi:hypothetical protein